MKPVGASQRIKLLTLREYTSSDGRTYMRGYLGDAVLLAFKDEGAEPQYGAQAEWSVYAVEKRQAGADRSAAARPARSSTRATKRAARQPEMSLARGSTPSDRPQPNDDIPF